MDAFEHHMVDVDGATLEVFLGGSGEPVVCQSHPWVVFHPEPGMGGNTPWPWDSTMGRCVGVNPRGVGGSSAGRGPRDDTYAQQIDDLEAVRQQLEIERWVFWGGSAGGAVALLYALAYPNALSGLIAEMAGPSGRGIAEDARSILNPFHAQYEQDRATPSSERRPATLAEVVPDLADAYWQPLGTEHWMLVQHDRPVIVCPGAAPRTWAGFEQWLTALDVEDRLGEIHLPTLIVAGEQDPFMPLAQVARLPAGIPDAEFLVLAESGHDVEQESVDGPKYAAAVRRFLATLASPDG